MEITSNLSSFFWEEGLFETTQVKKTDTTVTVHVPSTTSTIFPKISIISKIAYTTLHAIAKSYPIKPTTSAGDLLLHTTAVAIKELQQLLSREQRSLHATNSLSTTLFDLNCYLALWNSKVSIYYRELILTRKLWQDFKTEEECLYGSSEGFTTTINCCHLMMQLQRDIQRSELSLAPTLSTRVCELKTRDALNPATKLKAKIESLIQCILLLSNGSQDEALWLAIGPLQNIFSSPVEPTLEFVNIYSDLFFALTIALNTKNPSGFACPTIWSIITESSKKAESPKSTDHMEAILSLIFGYCNLCIRHKDLNLDTLSTNLKADTISIAEVGAHLGINIKTFTKERLLAKLQLISSDIYSRQMSLQHVIIFHCYIILTTYQRDHSFFSSKTLIDLMSSVQLWDTWQPQIQIPESFSPESKALLQQMLECQINRQHPTYFSDSFVTAGESFLTELASSHVVTFASLYQLLISFSIGYLTQDWYNTIGLPKLAAWTIQIKKLQKKNPEEAKNLLEWIAENRWLEMFDVAELTFSLFHELVCNNHLINKELQKFINLFPPQKKAPPRETPPTEDTMIPSPPPAISSEDDECSKSSEPEDGVSSPVILPTSPVSPTRRSPQKPNISSPRTFIPSPQPQYPSVRSIDIDAIMELLQSDKRKGRTIHQRLKAHGAKLLRQRGSHMIYNIGGAHIPIPNHGEIAKGTRAAIRRQLGHK